MLADSANSALLSVTLPPNSVVMLIVSAGKTPPTCDETVDLRPIAFGHNNGVPNRFLNLRANNPSGVFTQKCLCTTQECFYSLEYEK